MTNKKKTLSSQRAFFIRNESGVLLIGRIADKRFCDSYSSGGDGTCDLERSCDRGCKGGAGGEEGYREKGQEGKGVFHMNSY